MSIGLHVCSRNAPFLSNSAAGLGLAGDLASFEIVAVVQPLCGRQCTV
jgi:hypothetical protein